MLGSVLLYLSVISIFLTEKVYVVFFTGFIFYNFIVLIKRKILYRWQLLVIFFILFTIIASLSNLNSENLTLLIKLILNVLFLFSCGIYADYLSSFNIDRQAKIKRNIGLIILIIILLNFIQIVFVYLSSHTSLLYFLNVQNSIDAYSIFQHANIVVGHENKNIWASKITLIQLIYVFFFFDFKKNGHKLIILISILNVILLLSRTSQLAYFIVLIYWFLKKIKKWDLRYTFLLLIPLIFSLILIIKVFINQFLSIDLSYGDGGYTRILIWSTFFENIFHENYLTGIGLGGTYSFLLKYQAGYLNDNMHNFILNIWLELGLIGLLLYVTWLVLYIKSIIKRASSKGDILFMLIIPFFVIISLQYLGYDNDILLYLGVIYLLLNFKQTEKDNNY